MKKIFTAVGGIASTVIDGIGSFLTLILDAINGLVDLFVDSFKALLNFLFVPKDGFFNDKVTETKEALAKKFNMETYEQLFNALTSYVSGTISFDGYIDLKLWTKHLPTIKNFIRGFFYPLIILADVRFVLWLIRGTAPIAQSDVKA